MNSGPTISVGSSGNDVRRLQVLFVEMKVLDYTDIDSSFGPNTEGAVQSFQSSAGLAADGIVGPLTWGALPADPNTPQLATGDTGSAVSALQQGLTTYSTEDAAVNPGAIDGDFGPMTEAAVRAYQADRGVGVDGVVGDQTWWVPAGAAGATLATLSGLTTV
jgi:peptidoglycan hydrolase-like protein with peptidoglycan-binding domain